MPQEDLLRLLILDDSVNDAEMIISVLRNAGHPVRATMAEDGEDVVEALNNQHQDMFICNVTDPDYSIKQAYEDITKTGKDTVLIGLSDTDDMDRRIKVMDIGGHDLVSKSSLDHLRMVIEREMHAHKDRKNMRRFQVSMNDIEKRCNILLNNSRDAIAYISEGMHVYANKTYLDKFGYSDFDDFEGMTILDLVHPDNQTDFKDFLRSYSSGSNEDSSIEIKMIGGKDGDKTFDAHLDMTHATIDGEECIQIQIRDQSSAEEHNLEKQITSLSQQDIMTGLFNRHHFMEKVDDIIIQNQAGGDGKSHGVLFILIDEYKQIKDRSGLALADAYTTDLGKLIKNTCEHLDISARFSDSCFMVLVTEKGVNETMDVAEELRKAIEDHITDLNGTSASSTSSIGVVMLGDASGNAHDVVNLADHACTTAKSQGGNRVFLHQTSFDAKISQEEQTNWENTIIEAIAQDKLYLVYQPIACLQGDDMERYDIRIRLRGENNIEIRPDEFLHIAEKAHLMIDIDKWVITNTFKSLAQRIIAKPNTTFFLKLSREAVTSASTASFIKEQAAIHKVDMSKVVFEIAESLIVTHLNKVKEFYSNTSEIGCKFAIDHFGSGLNPFQIIKHISPDYLKIDNTITQDASSSPDSLEKLKLIIDSAHDMDKKVIATHLEDATSLAILWQCKVDYIQGYFLQEPSPDLNHDFNGLVI